MNIKIENGKALYEGLEIENQGDTFTALSYQIKDGMFQDGTYPLPEGWEVMKKDSNICQFCSWPKDEHRNKRCYYYSDQDTDYFHTDRFFEPKQTARLIRKEQNSAHGYTEGADITEQTHYCGQCGKPLTLVRPGKHQCDNPDCESNRASIGPLNDKKLSIDLSIKKSREPAKRIRPSTS